MLNAFSLDDRRIEAARRAIEIEFQNEECNTSVSIAEARMKEDSNLESIRRMCCCIPFRCNLFDHACKQNGPNFSKHVRARGTHYVSFRDSLKDPIPF